MDDPDYYFEECDFPVFGDLDSRGLRRVDSRLFISSLCCYDFTDSVRHLLTCTSGPSRVLFNDFIPAVLGYKNASPVTRDRSLLPLITTDGTYIVQYDFDMECHAFVLLKDGTE